MSSEAAHLHSQVGAPTTENTQGEAGTIVLPPHTQPQPEKTTVLEEEEVQPCCSLPATLGCFGSVIVFFIIFITIAGVLGQGQTTFCNGYSTVAVWALLQGCSFLFLGFLLILENLAARFKCVGLRDQLRTVVLWTACFFIAWAIAGNVWIIGDEDTGFGVVPTPCKDGNMGNRNLYHFCLAILIFLDITIPIGLVTIAVLTRDHRGAIFNKTLFGTDPAPPAPTTTQDSTVAPPVVDTTSEACCSTGLASACFGSVLIFFLIFVTIAGVLGQTETTFCNGYWNTSQAYMTSKHSTVAVWALLQGSALLLIGFLWFLENRAAVAWAFALRDRLRTMLLLGVVFNFGWLICGNTWIIGSTGAMGVIPQACKDGNMGNRNLYHFCLAMIIFLDITAPIALLVVALSTLDTKAGNLLNATCCWSAPAAESTPPPPALPSKARKVLPAACCSLLVSSGTFAFAFIPLALIFITVPSVLEPGTMAHAGDQGFCNGYWKDAVTYPGAMIAGHSTIAVWSLLMGSCLFLLGLLWFLESRAAAMNARALRDQLRTLLLLTSLFAVAWMITGNAWIISDTFNLGVIPDGCKNGNMGNRNLYHFVYAMIIFLDIMVPLALLAVIGRTWLNKTLHCCDPKEEPIPEEPAPVVEKSAPTLLIGQA